MGFPAKMFMSDQLITTIKGTPPQDSISFNTVSMTKVYHDGNLIWQKDAQAPVITITSAAGDTSELSYTLTFKVTDDNAIKSILVYEYRDNVLRSMKTGSGESLKSKNFSFSYNIKKKATYKFEIEATDAAGNVSKKAVEINKINNLPTAPVLSVSQKDFAWNNTPVTTRVTISGSTDKEDGTLKGENYSIKCDKASAIKLVSQTSTSAVYDVTFNKRAIGIIIATATDSDGGKAISTAQITIGAGSSAQSSGGQFNNGAFDSGYTDLVDGCYIKTVSFSVQIPPGHGNTATGDSMVIYGVTENGVEKEISGYRANFGSNLQSISVDVSGQKYRQVGFRTTSTHSSCAVSAQIKYNFTYEYSPELDDSTFRARTTYGGVKTVNWQGT